MAASTFDRTYEGLKPPRHHAGALPGRAFDRTYEGLKPPGQRRRSPPGPRLLTVPMRV